MRKAKPKKRVVLPDPVYGDQMVSKFVNHLMYDGKKNISYTIFYNALDLLAAKMKNEEKTPQEIWKQALENITPKVEVKSRRIGGATFQVPTEIRADRLLLYRPPLQRLAASFLARALPPPTKPSTHKDMAPTTQKTHRKPRSKKRKRTTGTVPSSGKPP